MATLTRTDRAKLQRLIDRTATACNAFNSANAALAEFCITHYGQEPGDIDADEIIDAVQGGAGTACGMSADEFDKVMRKG